MDTRNTSPTLSSTHKKMLRRLCFAVWQRWAHLTTPVWGAHHLDYMAPDIKSLSSMSPGTDDNKVIIFESVM